MADTASTSQPANVSDAPREFDDNPDVRVYTSFETMGLPEPLVRGIFNREYRTPSPIQERAIVPLASGRDLIAQGQSGTGKTAAFSIGALARIDFSQTATKSPQVIILTSTRELAIQIHSHVTLLGAFMMGTAGANCKVCVGGHSTVQEDRKALSEVVHVVVGTTGRIFDLVERRYLSTSNVKVLILDEADKMLSENFKESVYNIFTFMPSTVQVALFSATFPQEVVEVANKFLRNPVRILVKEEQVTLQGLQQYYVILENDDQKFAVLTDLYRHLDVTQVIIFANSRPRVDALADQLRAMSFTVSSIHSGMPQAERDNIMAQFRGSSSRVLVSTDLVCRGIDVQQVSLVINYDLTKDVSDYIHRIGRSARYGRKGVAINLITARDWPLMVNIMRYYSTEVQPLPQNVGEIIKQTTAAAAAQ